MKKVFSILTIFCILFATMAFSVNAYENSPMPASVIPYRGTAIITGNSVNLRSSSTTNSSSAGHLYAGDYVKTTKADFTASEGTWIYVEVLDVVDVDNVPNRDSLVGQKGWVYSVYVEMITSEVSLDEMNSVSVG